MPYNVNPMRLIKMIREGKNPQELMIGVLEDQVGSTPLGENLIYLAKNNRTKDIEQIARNIAKQKGLDFDAEFNAFKQRFGL